MSFVEEFILFLFALLMMLVMNLKPASALDPSFITEQSQHNVQKSLSIPKTSDNDRLKSI